MPRYHQPNPAEPGQAKRVAMSERRIVLRTDDGGEIEVRWTESTRKFTLEFEERPAVAETPAATDTPAPKVDE